MKYSKFLATLLFCSMVSFYACNEKADTKKQDGGESMEVTGSPIVPSSTTPDQPAPEPAQNAEGIWHYTCGQGCAGGAGVAGNCATCGNPLAHNAAYHGGANAAPANPTAVPSSPEPAQNAAGVWHYTCGKGCAGGAGSASNCGVCGGPLTHNATYHL